MPPRIVSLNGSSTTETRISRGGRLYLNYRGAMLVRVAYTAYKRLHERCEYPKSTATCERCKRIGQRCQPNSKYISCESYQKRKKKYYPNLSNR